MKKFLPFVFPLAATIIVLLLAFRWYSARTQRETTTPMAEGVQIENLSESELKNVLRGVGDVKTVNMTSETEEVAGSIRYEIVDGKVRLSVTANLPELTEGQYQVWFKEANKEKAQPAFVLEDGKAGFIGSAAIDQDSLPLEIIVSKELRPDNEIEQVLLRGTVAQEEK
jgi:isocitrate dehydrogenase